MKSLFTCLSLVLFSMLVMADDPKSTRDGTWELTKGVVAGNDMPDEITKSVKLVIKGDTYETIVQGQSNKGSVTSDDTTKPKRMKIESKDGPTAGKTLFAIYELNINKDELKVCYDLEGKEYPKEFKSPEGSKLFYAIYKRSK